VVASGSMTVRALADRRYNAGRIFMAFCKSCIMKWLPKALQDGKSKWETLHPRVRRILTEAGYDRKGNKVR
jgi:hypothetical protein